MADGRSPARFVGGQKKCKACLMLCALDQSSLDGGNWLLAQEMHLEPGQPWPASPSIGPQSLERSTAPRSWTVDGCRRVGRPEFDPLRFLDKDGREVFEFPAFCEGSGSVDCERVLEAPGGQDVIGRFRAQLSPAKCFLCREALCCSIRTSSTAPRVGRGASMFSLLSACEGLRSWLGSSEPPLKLSAASFQSP